MCSGTDYNKVEVVLSFHFCATSEFRAERFGGCQGPHVCRACPLLHAGGVLASPVRQQTIDVLRELQIQPHSPAPI